MKEQDIIEQAFIHLQNELEGKVKWEHQVKVPKNGYDAKFTLNGNTIYVEAKSEVRPNQLKKFERLKQQYGDVLIAANYITPNAKKLLIDKELNYIDRAGNIRFRLGTIYIHIDGLPNQQPAEDRKNRAFTRTGIKVVFQFLNNPALINATYREIVNATGAALGTIPKVIDGLREDGYILKKTDDKWIITDFDELLNRWQNEYLRKLKPALFTKRYRPINEEFYVNWNTLELKGQALWGGEPAGDHLTAYLKPETYTLYTNQTHQEIMKTYKWIPHPEGEIYVYKQFWRVKENQTSKKTAPAIIVYADLMETKDSRCIETANLIYEQYIQEH